MAVASSLRAPAASAVLVASLVLPAASAWAAPPVRWDGQVRGRYEYRDPLDYRVPGTLGRPASQSLADRGDIALLRTRVGLGFVPLARVSGYVQVQDSRTMGSEPSVTANTANLDVHQAWVELDSLAGGPLQLRVGRTELAYGDQRLVGALDWSNVGRAFDGARLRWTPKGIELDAFLAWVGEGRTTGRDRLFSGVHATWRPDPRWELQGYVFGRSFGDTLATGETGRGGRVDDLTPGARVRFAAGALDLRGEAAWQSGRRAGDDVEAWAAAARGTIQLHGGSRLKLTGGLAAASGDGAVDGRYERFDQLYPTWHTHLGFADLVGWQNIVDVEAGVSIEPAGGLLLQADLHQFRLMEASDGWFDATGGMLRRNASGGAGDELGWELDLTARWVPRSGITLQGGYSSFAAGDFVDRTGGGGGQDWGYVQMTVGF